DANSGLVGADLFATKYAVAADSPQIKILRGESYFLRAYYYMQLECLYGEKYINLTQPASSDANVLGVPIYTTIPTDLAGTSAPRSTARQVWTLIIKDLDSARSLLPASWPATNMGRATSWTAKGLLGKVFVYTQEWDSAKAVLLDVITNGTGPRGLPLQLMPFNIYKQAFNSNAFPGSLNNNTDQKFNQESIFELEIDRVPGNGGYGIFGNSPNLYLTSSMGLFLQPSGFKNDGVGWQGMGYGDGYISNENLNRFGFNVSPDSLDASSLVANQSFVANSTSTLGYVSTTKVPGTYYQHVSDSFRTTGAADPRLYVCALEPYMDTVVFSESGSPSDRYKRPVSKTVNISPGDGFLAWSLKKYQTLDAGIQLELTQSDGANLYFLRLADIYLLYAEACMNTSDNVDALEYINKVHRRAYNQPINTPSAVDYISLTDLTKAGASDVNLGHNPLAYERHAELFAEGNWWFDIGRWGNSTNSTPSGPNNFNSNFGLNEANFYGNSLTPLPVQPSRWTNIQSYSYPIPSTEINANTALASQPNGGQNPGY
ncbi:MAG TPA: RagB/SusD family nutrient uptake outer membrane protein, partial [Bacteroidia bacterium]|nr:RagB/SusD family nutrient uptake outer membrane protein [Bacteroidia bacterium]